jgi:hypothetical protein
MPCLFYSALFCVKWFFAVLGFQLRALCLRSLLFELLPIVDLQLFALCSRLLNQIGEQKEIQTKIHVYSPLYCVVTISNANYFFIWLNFGPVSCHFSLKNTFSIFFKWQTVSCSPESILFCPSFLKENVSRYRIPGWQIFFFLHFEYVVPMPLASVVSNEKQAVNLMEEYLFVMTCCFQDSALALDNLIMMCLYISLHVSILVHWSFWCVH